MGLYRVKGTDLLHNGKFYKEGSEIKLSDKEAKTLSSWIEPVKEKPPEGDDPTGGSASTGDGEPASRGASRRAGEGTQQTASAGKTKKDKGGKK